MNRFKAFLLGVRESHLSITTRVEGKGENAYEYGRRFVWWVTGIEAPAVKCSVKLGRGCGDPNCR